MRFMYALAAGLVFGSGILLSGMANPAKILNFFDVAGTWDPSLAFVMGGALTVTTFGYRFVWLRRAPVAAKAFLVPASRVIDRRLLLGAATFGVGWGIAGFCPGGAVPAIGLFRLDVAVFVVALAIGLVAAGWLDRHLEASYVTAIRVSRP